MGMIRRGRKRLGATRDSLRSQAGVGKETLGGCRECHGETPRHERLFEVTEVGADVRFVERDGLHRRRRFMSDVGGRAGAGAARTFFEVWPFADLILQTKVRSAPSAAIPASSVFGRFETCRPGETMSVPGGRSEVAGPLSK